MIFFHRLLIGTAILFTAGAGWWMVQASLGQDNPFQLAVGVFFLLATVGLVYYLKNLKRFVKNAD